MSGLVARMRRSAVSGIGSANVALRTGLGKEQDFRLQDLSESSFCRCDWRRAFFFSFSVGHRKWGGYCSRFIRHAINAIAAPMAPRMLRTRITVSFNFWGAEKIFLQVNIDSRNPLVAQILCDATPVNF
jgi:hypothetical protein